MDGTTNQKDTSGQVQDSSKGKAGTSEKTPETSIKEAQDKAVSDALSAAGRTAKALEAREQAIKASEAKELERQKQKDADELAEAEGNTEKLTLVQQRQKHRADQIVFKQEREQFEKEKAEHQADIDAANATKFEIAMFNIATKHEVDADWLKGIGISDLKQLEEIAKGASVKKPFVPDSGKTIGGGEVPASAKGKILSGWEKLHPGK